MALRPTVFDRYILPFDVAAFAQPLAERDHIRCIRAGRGAAEEADHRNRLLLRAEAGRCRHRAGQQQQLAPSHSITHAPLPRGMIFDGSSAPLPFCAAV